jgi:hypothetical protein
MKLSRIWGAFPWRMALILALIPCLPVLGFWAWFRWELPPLQQYYLVDYWASSEGAKQPGSQTQIQWLMETAPGRKSRFLFASSVSDESHNGLPLELSLDSVQQGWVSIAKTPVESIGSAELEGLLKEGFFDGQSFSELIKEPLLDGLAFWLILVYLTFMMRGDIGNEWRRLRRAVGGLEWESYSRAYWPDNREGIAARIRSRMAHWKSEKSVQLMWANFKAAISRQSGLNKHPNPERLNSSDRPASTGGQSEVSTPQQLVNALPSNSREPPSQRRTIFPGSSPSETAPSSSKPWEESEWID